MMLSNINGQNRGYLQKTNQPAFKGGFQLFGKEANHAYERFLPTVKTLAEKNKKIQIKKITGFEIPRFHVTCEKNLDVDIYSKLHQLAKEHNLELEANNVDYYKDFPKFNLEEVSGYLHNVWNDGSGLGTIKNLIRDINENNR